MTKTFINRGLSPLRRVLTEHQFQSVLMIVGGASYDNVRGLIAPLLTDVQTRHFVVKNPFPVWGEITRVARLIRSSSVDAVVAVGGGRVIDVGKAGNALAHQDGDDYLPYLRGERALTVAGLPFIVLPTTAGSGSEATPFAVVYRGARKYSLHSPLMQPPFVVADGALVAGVPHAAAAAAGLDAFCQAAESWWSRRATRTSITYSGRAIALVRGNLQPYLRGDAAAAGKMVEAAHWAGKAIAITRTTAPHALSYALTRRHGIAHGHAVALTFGVVAAHAAAHGGSVTRRRLNAILALLNVASGAEFVPYWRTWMADCGLTSRLSGMGIGKDDVPVLAGDVNAERLDNHPVALSADILKRLLEECW